MQIRSFALAIALSLTTISSAHADIWATTDGSCSELRFRLTSRVEGQWGNAAWNTFVDAVQVARDFNTVYGAYAGPGGLTSDWALKLGVPRDVVDQAATASWYGDVSASPFSSVNVIEHIADLLDFVGDKTVKAADFCSVSKDIPGFQGARGRIRFEFSAVSDDDPFGQLVATIANTQLSAGSINLEGRHTRHATATVIVDVSRLEPGTYPIEFLAKEEDCAICLSIVHSVILVVSDPCPNPNATCATKTTAYARLREEQRQALADSGYARLLTGLRSNERAALAVIDLTENACVASPETLGPTIPVDPSEGYSGVAVNPNPTSVSGQAATIGNARGACLRNAQETERELQGACPDIVLNATSAQCAQLDLAKTEYERTEAEYAERFRSAIDQLLCEDCCDPLLNPNGRGQTARMCVGSVRGVLRPDPDGGFSRPTIPFNPRVLRGVPQRTLDD